MKKNKNILLLIVIAFSVYTAKAQNFFYIDSQGYAQIHIKDELLKASQFISKNPFTSEYTIKVETNAKKKSSIPVITISLIDSMTFKTIFLTQEEFHTPLSRLQPEAALSIAIDSIIERNIKDIIAYAKYYSFHSYINSINLKKDKT